MRAMTLEAVISVHPWSCLSLQNSEIKWPTAGFSQQAKLVVVYKPKTEDIRTTNQRPKT